MKTPESNSIDFESVSVEEAVKVGSPAEHIARIAELDTKYTVSEENIAPKPEEVAKLAVLQESFQTQPVTPEAVTKVETPSQEPSAKQEGSKNDSEKAYQELLAQYPSIANSTLEQARMSIDEANPLKQFQDVEKFTLPLLVGGMGFIAANASAIPAFIAALAAGPTGVVTATGLAVAGTFGVVPIVAGTAYLVYSGYKLFKNIRANSKRKAAEKKLDVAWGNA